MNLFLIDVAMDFNISFDAFVDTFSVRARNLLNFQKRLFLQWVYMIWPFRDTYCLMIFMIFFVTILAWIRYEFLHRYWFHFGTPLSNNSMFWGDNLLDDVGDGAFINFEQKWLPKIDAWGWGAATPFSSPFSRKLVHFTLVRLSSARNRFPNFSTNNNKLSIHTCAFYPSKTDKCAVTVFAILMKKITVRKLFFERSKAWFWSNVC